jgi:hypothetical protein
MTPLRALADAYVGVLKADREWRRRHDHRDPHNPVLTALADRAAVVFEHAIDAPTWEAVAQLNKIAGELLHG